MSSDLIHSARVRDPVKVIITKPALSSHTIRVRASERKACRALVDQILRYLDLPRRAGVVRFQGPRQCYSGYVFVYKGEGTSEDKKRFARGCAFARQLMASP